MALGGFFISGRLMGLQGLLSPDLSKGMVYRQIVCREGCLVNLFKKGVVELWEHQRSSSGRCCLGFVSERGGLSCGARVRLVLAGPLPTLRVGALVRVPGRAGRELGARFVPRTNRKRAPQTARPLHPTPGLCPRQGP